jgi:hypothetical protein
MNINLTPYILGVIIVVWVVFILVAFDFVRFMIDFFNRMNGGGGIHFKSKVDQLSPRSRPIHRKAVRHG